MTVRKIQKSWRVDIKHNHVRYRRKSPENSKSGAQAYEALLRQKLARGEPLDVAEPDEKQKEREQKFEAFAWKWFDIHVRNNNKHSEISHKKYILRGNLVPFFGKTPIERINTLQVEQYKAKKIGKGLSAKTVNNHLTVLSSCLRTAQDWFDLKKLPKMKKLKAPPPETVFLSHEECVRLLANSNGVWREIIFTALKTGLRQGELRALQWEDIDWENKILTVRRSWCEYKKGFVTPKSNRERHIPLTNELYEMLLLRRQATGDIFIDERNQRFDGKTLNQKMIGACKKAGTKEITCHALRHTFASHLAMAGASLKAIQELLGHSNIQTTMRYAHLSSSTLREAVGLLEKVGGVPTHPGHYRGTPEKHPINVSSSFKLQIPELSLFKANNER